MKSTRSHIPATPFAATTLSTNDFRWLHQEGWENYHIEYFAGSRGTIPLLISAPAPAAPRKRGAQLKLWRAGRWILESNTHRGQPLAWAEAQFLAHSFAKTQINLYVSPEAKELSEQISQALCLLISGCFVLSKSDIVTIIPYGDAPRFLNLLSGMEKKPQLSFLSFGWATPNLPPHSSQLINTFSTSKASWAKTVEGHFALRQLSYLEKRLKEREFRPQKFRRGLLGFLFPRRPCC